MSALADLHPSQYCCTQPDVNFAGAVKTLIHPSVRGWGGGATSVHSALRNQTVKKKTKKKHPKRWNWLNLQPGSFFLCFFWKQHVKMKEAAEGSKTLSITDTGISKGTGTGDCSDSPAQLRRGGGREGCCEYKKVRRDPRWIKTERASKEESEYLSQKQQREGWNYFGTWMEVRHLHLSQKMKKKKKVEMGASSPTWQTCQNRSTCCFFFFWKKTRKKSLNVNCLAAHSTPALPRTRTMTLQKSLPSPLRMRREKEKEKKKQPKKDQQLSQI